MLNIEESHLRNFGNWWVYPLLSILFMIRAYLVMMGYAPFGCGFSELFC